LTVSTGHAATDHLTQACPERGGFPFKVHVHMLRHACGYALAYALANAGHDTRAIQDWLGHRAIQHTARYTELTKSGLKIFGGPDLMALRDRQSPAARLSTEQHRPDICAIQGRVNCLSFWPSTRLAPGGRG
jgi:hypothetical protein